MSCTAFLKPETPAKHHDHCMLCVELGGGGCCLSLRICSSATCACASPARPLLLLPPLHCPLRPSCKQLWRQAATSSLASVSSRSIPHSSSSSSQRSIRCLLTIQPPRTLSGTGRELWPGSALLKHQPRLLAHLRCVQLPLAGVAADATGYMLCASIQLRCQAGKALSKLIFWRHGPSICSPITQRQSCLAV